MDPRDEHSKTVGMMLNSEQQTSICLLSPGSALTVNRQHVPHGAFILVAKIRLASPSSDFVSLVRTLHTSPSSSFSLQHSTLPTKKKNKSIRTVAACHCLGKSSVLLLRIQHESAKSKKTDLFNQLTMMDSGCYS